MLQNYRECLKFDYDLYSEIFRSLWSLTTEERKKIITGGNRQCFVPACTCHQMNAFYASMVQTAIEAGEPCPERRPHVCEDCQYLEGDLCRLDRAKGKCEYFESKETGE